MTKRKFTKEQKIALERAFDYPKWRMIHPKLKQSDYERMANTFAGGVALLNLSVAQAFKPITDAFSNLGKKTK